MKKRRSTYRLEILGASEIKIKGKGVKSVGEGKWVFVGIQEGRTKVGVTVHLSKRMSECLREWKCVSEEL